MLGLDSPSAESVEQHLCRPRGAVYHTLLVCGQEVVVWDTSVPSWPLLGIRYIPGVLTSEHTETLLDAFDVFFVEL